MKHTLQRTLLLLALLLIAALVFTACSFGGKDDESDKGDNTTAEGITADHNTAEIAQKMDAMRTNGGLHVKLHVTSTEDGTVEQDDVEYAANGDIYYYNTGADEVYFVFGTENLTAYTKREGIWNKTVYTYNEAFTKAQADAMASSYAAMLGGYFGYWQAFADIPGATTVKSTEVVASRNCDKYTITVAAMGAGATVEVCIDRETGACLKLTGTGVSLEGSSSLTLECTEFTTPYTITLPTVDAAHTHTGDGTGTGDDTGNTGTGDGTDTGTDDGGNTTALVSFAGAGIDAETTFAALTDSANGGFAVSYNIRQTTPATVTFAAKNDVYCMVKIYNGNIDQHYVDLSDPAKAVMYEYNAGTGKWETHEIVYSGDVTKEAVLNGRVKTEFVTVACMNSTHTAADLFKTANAQPQYVQRTADLYTSSNRTETFLIDRQTGLCLEYTLQTSNSTIAYICTDLEFGIDDIELPNVNGGQGGQGGTGDDGGNTGTGDTTDLVSFAGEGYNADTMFAALADPTGDGFGVTYMIRSNEPGQVTFMTKGDVYKMYTVAADGTLEQSIIDLRDATKAVMYEYDAETRTWSKQERLYGNGVTKASMLDMITSSFFMYAGKYSTHTATDLVKTANAQPQFAQRTAIRYDVNGSNPAEYYLIDTATGLCLEWSNSMITYLCYNLTLGIEEIEIPETTGQGGESGQGQGGEGSQGQGEGGTTTDLVSFSGEGYNADTTFATLTDPTGDGFGVTYMIRSRSPYQITFMAKGDVYKMFTISGDGTITEQSIADLRDATKAVMYGYDVDSEQWQKEEIVYDDNVTKADMVNMVKATFLEYAGKYAAHTATDLIKTADVAPQFVRRTADKYEINGSNPAEYYLIDRATGVCLEWSNSSMTYICSSLVFEIDDIEIPEETALFNINDDFDADDVLIYLVAADHGGFSIEYRQNDEIVTARGKGGIYVASNNCKGTTWYDVRNAEKGVAYEGNDEDGWYAWETVYAECEMTKWDFLYNGEFGQAWYMMTSYRDADTTAFIRTEYTYKRGDLTRDAYLYECEESKEKYIIDAETGVCLLHQTEWDTYYCTAFEMGIADLVLPEVSVEPEG